MARLCALLRRLRRSWPAAAFRKIPTPPDGLGFTCLAACQSPSRRTGKCAPFRPDHFYASISADCTSRSSIIRSREPTAKRKNDRSRLKERKRLKALVREALLDSVRHHLVADVPVGAFLSAGVDSGALVGLMREAGQQDIQTVTLAFDEFRGTPNDEAPEATAVADFYGTRHTTRVVGENEFRADLPAIIEAMDQPTIDGINAWFVSKAAHELGLKVAISGLGGDELFGGYSSFRDLPTWVRWMAAPSSIPFLGQILRRAFRRMRGERLGVNS